MNEEDPLIHYADASTKAIGCVLMQVQNGIEKHVIFISHALSDQTTRWGIMELELYAFVYCVKNLTPCLLGKQFTVRTDHRNLLYLSNSSGAKVGALEGPPIGVPVFVQHIPGDQNVVADGLTRVPSTTLMEMSMHKRHLFVDDLIQRIFRLGGEEELEETYVPGEVEEVGKMIMMNMALWKCMKCSQDTTTQSLGIWVWSEY